MQSGMIRRAAGAQADDRRRSGLGVLAVVAVGLAVAGCNTSSAPTASAVAAQAQPRGPTIAFDSIDGPPIGVFNRLVDSLSGEAESRRVAVVSREAAASYRVRGYLAAHVERGRSHIGWVWDVYDGDRRRTLRISGEEAGGRAGSDAWAAADEAMLRRIARTSMDQLTAFLGVPDAPAAPATPARPAAGPVVAAAPGPARALALAAAPQ